MKFKTKKGHEITIGNPEHRLHDHIDNIAGRAHTIAKASSSLAAVAAFAPKRGNGVRTRLERASSQTAAVGTLIAAGATALRVVHALRNPEGPAASQDLGRTFTVPQHSPDGSLDALRDAPRGITPNTIVQLGIPGNESSFDSE